MKARLVVVLMLLLPVACGNGSSGNRAKPTAQATELPPDQQTLTVATPGDVYITRNKAFLGMWPDQANICETLVGLGQDLQPVPVLATKWTYTGNNTYRFDLRRGVTFQNGQPFTAEAVRYSMNRLVMLNQTLNTFLGPDSTKVVDDYTVDITPTQPNLRLPEQIAHPFFSIIAPSTDPADHPVCTGPFTFSSYSPNDRLVVQRNDSYWGEKAKLRQMTFRFIPDQNTRLLALESGEIDLEWFVAPQTTTELKNRAGLRVAPAPPGAVVIISFNLHGDPPYDTLQDADVRRALALSFDAKALGDQQWQGNAQAVPTVSPPSVLGAAASQVKQIVPDLAKAGQLLDAKGWKVGADGIRERNGQKLSLSAVAQFDFENESLQFLQAQLRKAGVDLKVDHAADGAVYSQKLNSGAWDVDINYFNQNDANPVRIPAQFWWSKTNNARVKLTNPGPAFDALVDEANSAPDLATSQRKAAEANTELVSTTAGAIALTSFPQIYALKSSVAGFTPHPSVNHQMWTTVFRTATS
jgi:peptide/nickel transport system substrate-binding protein